MKGGNREIFKKVLHKLGVKTKGVYIQDSKKISQSYEAYKQLSAKLEHSFLIYRIF